MKKLAGFSIRTQLHASLPEVLFLGLFATILIAFTQSGAAQDSVPTAVTINNLSGDVPYSAQIGTQFEHVELSNGNLIINIPFVSTKGRGMSFDYGIKYDAAYWVIQNQGGGPPAYWNPEMRNWLTASALGWTSNQPYETYQAGEMSCYTGTATTQPDSGTPPSDLPTPQGSRIDSVIFSDQNGSKHQILINFQSNGDCAAGAYNFANIEGPSLGQDGFWGNGAGGTVTDPSGIVYSQGGTSGGASFPTQGTLSGAMFFNMAAMKDTRSNTQTLTPGSSDTVGRIPITEQTSGKQLIYTVNDSSGNPQKYKVNLESIPISTSFDDTFQQVAEYSGTRVSVASVLLPNGQSYGFTYDSYGDITKITLPTGGFVSYVWTNVYSAGSPVRSITSRTVNDGVTSYTWTITYAYSTTTSNYTVTLTSPADPQGAVHHTVYTYGSIGGPPVLLSVLYDPSSNGSYLKGYSMTYSQTSGLGSESQSLLTSITTTLNAGAKGAGGTVSQRQFDYHIFGFESIEMDCTTPNEESVCEQDAAANPKFMPSVLFGSDGNVTAIREYDWGSAAPGPLLRQTIRTYLQDSTAGYGMTPTGLGVLDRVGYTGVNIVDRAVTETIYDGSATCSGQGSIDFSSGAYIPPPACGAKQLAQRTVQYDDQSPSSYGFHGEETATAQWLGSSNTFLTTSYVHDSFGNLTSITDPNGNTTTIGYGDSFASGVPACSIESSSSAYPTSVTDALGHIRAFTYYGCTGKLEADQDPNDIANSRAGTTFTYDEMNRVLIKDTSDGGQTSNTYSDSYPNTVTVSKLLSSGVSVTNVATSDGLGRTITTSLTSDPSGATTVNTTYDGLGRTYTVSNPHRSASSPSDGLTTTLYDGIGRPLSVLDQDGNTKTWAYNGNATTSTDESGNQWARTSDALGRLTKVMEPNGTLQIPSMETDYTYDGLSNLLSVKQWGGASGSSGARTRSFTYDSLSRLVQAFNPETGWLCYGTTTSNAAPNGSNCTEGYDANGNLSTKTDGRGDNVSYTYDALNRKTSEVSTTLPTFTHSFYYDQTSVAGITFSNPIGRLTTVSTWFNGSPSFVAETSLYWNHDAMGRVSGTKTCIETACNTTDITDSTWHDLSNTYDLAGNMTSYTDGFGTTVSATYDAAGRLSIVTTAGNGTTPTGTLWTANTYGAVGLTQATFGSNQAVESLQYNKRLALVSSSTAVAGNPALYSESLSYFGNMNLQTASDSVNGNWTYTYDTLNRLSTGVASNTGTGCLFGYDPFGNRTGEAAYQGTCFAPTPFTFTGTATNRVDGYCYDGAGNLLDASPSPCPGTGVKDQYYYDGFGNLLSPNYNSATPDSYTVDALGQRIAKWSGSGMTNQYLYGADGEAVAEMDGSGKWVRTNVRMGGQLLAELQGTKAYFRLNDHLGTLRAELGSDGCLSTYTSLPFGDGQTTVANGCADITLHHFTGKERDTESGNDYFGARYYGSNMGRFMSPDPSSLLAQRPENPQSWNLYTYALNNPLTNIDPNGLDCVYANDAGNGVESIDHHSNSGECGDNGGSWVPGYAAENWAHFNNNTGLFQVGSYTSGDSVDYTTFQAGATTQWNGDESSCTSGCNGFASANADGLVGQLVGNSKSGGLDRYIQFLTGRTEPLGGGLLNQLVSGPLDPSTDHWAGPGGFGPPGGQGDWAASVHDYNFNTNGIKIGTYFNPTISPETARALIQSNNNLIRNAGGIQSVKMGLFFGVVNAFQWASHVF